MLLVQLELISVVNKDKTAEPGDMISFTNHLAGNNRRSQEGSIQRERDSWES